MWGPICWGPLQWQLLPRKTDAHNEGAGCPDPSLSMVSASPLSYWKTFLYHLTTSWVLSMPRFEPLISVVLSEGRAQKIVQWTNTLLPLPLLLKWQKHRPSLGHNNYHSVHNWQNLVSRTACMTDRPFSSPVERKNCAWTFSTECPRAQKSAQKKRKRKQYQLCSLHSAVVAFAVFYPVVAQCNWVVVSGLDIKFLAS